MKFKVNSINKKNLSIIKSIVFAGVLFGICHAAFAAGTDLLYGTDANIMATIQGTGKKYLYITESILASVGYLKTRQATAFLGIAALSVGFNVLLSFVTMNSM